MGLGMMVFMSICAQWESILGVPWEINGVHIVGVNNMELNAP